jgi:hypothetical protein
MLPSVNEDLTYLVAAGQRPPYRSYLYKIGSRPDDVENPHGLLTSFLYRMTGNEDSTKIFAPYLGGKNPSRPEQDPRVSSTRFDFDRESLHYAWFCW